MANVEMQDQNDPSKWWPMRRGDPDNHWCAPCGKKPRCVVCRNLVLRTAFAMSSSMSNCSLLFLSTILLPHSPESTGCRVFTTFNIYVLLRRNANGGPYSMPVQLRLTSVLGDTVLDQLRDWQGGEVRFIHASLPHVQPLCSPAEQLSM